MIALTGPAHAAGLSPDRARAGAHDLGARSAGTYYDAARDAMVVAVLDRASAQEVRAAGGVARVVEHSTARLERIRSEIDDAATVPGTTYGIDASENKVVLTVDDTVAAPDRRRLDALLADEGDAARIERIAGRLQQLIAGGEAILGDDLGGDERRCSLGFNVDIADVDYFVTAGHCSAIIASWTTPPGVTAASDFPGDDFGLVRHAASTARPGAVSLYDGTSQDITSADNPYEGQRVRRSGSTTGVRSGRVTRLDVTATLTAGRVDGLALTTACAEPGDSGGPFFAGTVALGLTSSGWGNCTTGGETLFQPVVEALDAYGASVY